MADDIGDEEFVNRKKNEVLSDEMKRANVIRALTLHRDGRDFLWWLMEQGSPFTSSMRFDSEGRSDLGRIGHAEGWRALGAAITIEIMQADAKAYVLMLQENKMKEKKNVRPPEAE